MTKYQAFTVSELETQQGDHPYLEFLRREGMSLGIYTLPVNGADSQHPHAADEVYYVLRGRAALLVEDERIDVGPGSVVSVDRGSEHHFIDITEELSLLVIFAPPSTPET